MTATDVLDRPDAPDGLEPPPPEERRRNPSLASTEWLGAHALVLHGHLPAGERDDAGAGRLVTLVQGGAAEGLGGGGHGGFGG